ncbi:MAG: SPOR domain-containing protein [Pelistega sp.]|nr:SPOR domain-containing protein [Pelistega sp.]
MGLFKTDRVQTSQRRSTGQRMSMADQQANELRYKAKSRLIGAVVLVILAIILVPMVMQDSQEADPSQAQAPLVAPQGQTDIGASGTLSVTTAPGVSASGTESMSQAVNPDGTVTSTGTSAQGTIAQGDISTTVPSTSVAASTSTEASVPAQGAPSVAAGTREQNVVTAPASEARTVSEAATKPAQTKPAESKPAETKPATAATKPTTKPAEPKTEKPAVVRTPSSRSTIREQDRTDDGQAALALLEGRRSNPAASSAAAAPRASAPAPAASGNSRFSIQLASHSTMDAARLHRERLSGSGVSNAYVQSATVNGRQTYRVRVGPFTSREAAQAAQTRLRGLGEGGFISSN